MRERTVMDQTEQNEIRDHIELMPYCRMLGMTLDRVEQDGLVLSMPYDAELIGDPATGVLHGGAVSALMDTACGVSVAVHPQGARDTATLDLRIDYMRGAVPGQRLHARAICTHFTRSVAFVRATAWGDDESRPVATATGAFTLTHVAGAAE